MEDPRYPIGRFAFDGKANPQLREQWMAEIAAAPGALRAAVAGLGPAQLDTPYREQGWSVRQVVHHLPDSHLNAYTRFKLALTEEEPVIKPYDEARWAELPYALLARISNRIVNEVRGINRVVYDISGKPPATIEWE